MKGPYPIVCRAHSGGRILSQIYLKNGIQMGKLNPVTKDTFYFAVRGNSAVKKIISNSQKYLMPTYKKRKLQSLMIKSTYV